MQSCIHVSMNRTALSDRLIVSLCVPSRLTTREHKHVQEYALSRVLRPLNVAVVSFRCWYVWNSVTTLYGSAHCRYRVNEHKETSSLEPSAVHPSPFGLAWLHGHKIFSKHHISKYMPRPDSYIFSIIWLHSVDYYLVTVEVWTESTAHHTIPILMCTKKWNILGNK